MRAFIHVLEIIGKILLGFLVAVVLMIALMIPVTAIAWASSVGKWQAPIRDVFAAPFMNTAMQIVQALLAWNFMQGNVYGFAVSGLDVHSVLLIAGRGPVWLSGGAFGAEGSVVASVVLSAASLAVWRIYGFRLRLRGRFSTGNL